MSDDRYDEIERAGLLADEINDLRIKLQQAEDADLAFRIQVQHDCENAESAPARIKAALGEYGKDWTGDWLDEAVGRLQRQRLFTKQHLAERLDEALAADMPTGELVDLVLNVLGVTVRDG